MKAAFVTRFGGPDVLQIREVPAPQPGPGEVRVRIRAIGLNFADLMARIGVYPGIPKPPFIPGLEFSGDIDACGQGAVVFKPGDRVMGYSRIGSHAEYVAIGEKMLAPLPQSMSYETAASFLVAAVTAHHGLVHLAHLTEGESVLIHAAAGGVGLASVQLARHLGAEVFATAGSDEKVALAASNGAHHAMNYRTEDFAGKVRRLRNGGGVNVVMDSVGGQVYDKSWPLLEEMGRYILFGISAIAGQAGLNRLHALRVFLSMRPILPQSLLQSNKALFGFNLGTLKHSVDHLRDTAEKVIRLYDAGVLKPLIGKTFSLDEIVEAHRFLQTRKSVGKVVVLP